MSFPGPHMRGGVAPGVGDGLRHVRLIVPSGIGDLSWVYSKIHALSEALGGWRVIVSPIIDSGERRSEAYARLLPNVEWGGYHTADWVTQVMTQTIPSEWPFREYGWTPIRHSAGKPLYVSANFHLEMGRRIEDWIPYLPADHHYPLNLSPADTRRAKQILAGVAGPVFCVFVANRKTQESPAWRMWTDEEWADFLSDVLASPGAEGATLLFLGGAWDRDRAMEIGSVLARRGAPVRYALGEPLGSIVACMIGADFFLAYPGGLGIVANVVRLPGMMMLPRWLAGLSRSYADPADLESGAYHAPVTPTPAEALAWFRTVGVQHVGRTPWSGKEAAP